MENSYVPEIYVGENGNWFINGVDTGTKAQGDPGKDGLTPHIGADGFWYSGENNTLVKAQGEKGDTGVPGIQGAKGDKGDNGAAGPQGSTGPQGLTGSQGPTGATGPQGMTGPKGDTGVAGPQGSQGLQGPRGDIGAQGPQGCQGSKGEKGEPGPVNIANNLTTSTTGFALDARQGKVLKDIVDSVSSNLTTIKIVLSGGTYGIIRIQKCCCKNNRVLLDAYITIPAGDYGGDWNAVVANVPAVFAPKQAVYIYLVPLGVSTTNTQVPIAAIIEPDGKIKASFNRTMINADVYLHVAYDI